MSNDDDELTEDGLESHGEEQRNQAAAGRWSVPIFAPDSSIMERDGFGPSRNVAALPAPRFQMPTFSAELPTSPDGEFVSSLVSPSVPCSSAGDPTGTLFNKYIVATLDDGYINYTTSSFITGQSAAKFGDNKHAFFRWTNVTIPNLVTNSITIKAAFVRFTCNTTITDGTPDTRIWGNYSGDATAPTSIATYNALEQTGYYRDWTPSSWTVENTYDTPDITCIIEEILSHPSWISGNALQLMFTNSTANGYDKSPYDYTGGSPTTKSAELRIYYVTNHTPTITAAGVVCSGSADTALIKSPTIVPAGVLASGSATVAVVYSHEVTAEGVICAGSGVGPFEETMDGGVVCAGSAEVTSSTNITTSGGVIVSGARWLYRRTLTVPTGRVSSNIEKFYLPVAVQLDPAKASDSVLFTTSDGRTPIAFELRQYDITSGRLWVYVKTPLNAGNDNVIYIYYGDNS